ncbi:eukaryotic translation initiation factor 3 subunit 8 [Dacryopinax primogenitus]|uniref:Eukaryotic translation initiation factor 3 subunit C n=1 Tax=Dacryopinax primogenitus (strain DJM 731) TaxID=1858805 RepID=M5G6V6_DACPD|nr:eukaryotic translation initiation factor 3 subunit 8 [Dacryopinax primogenitus]EJU04439.1 eukaryotic translation initiation factor 3 subunit 8 [Dacryopinax primogenitus]
MSRFLRTAGDESEEESSEEEEEMSEEDEEEDDEAAQTKKVPGSRFLKGAESESESEEEEKKIVKSAKDKRVEEIEGCAKSMDNALKINDWVKIQDEFDKLLRLVQRQALVNEATPPLYIKTLVDLDSSMNAALAKEKTASKKMQANNARALNAMRSKLRKTLKENEEQIKVYTEDPEAFERAYQAQQAPPEPVAAPAKARKVRVELDEVEAGAAGGDDFTTVGKGGKALSFTADQVLKTLASVAEARGKKNTDRAEQSRILDKLAEVAGTTYQQIRVFLALVSSRFDYNPMASYMPLDAWASAKTEIDNLVKILMRDAQYAVVEDLTLEYNDLDDRSPQKEDGLVRIRGSIISFVDRLDDEFTRSLQNIDPHGQEYVERLKDERGLYETICRAQMYFEQKQVGENAARIAYRRLDHIYSKPDILIQALEQDVATAMPDFPRSSSSLTSAGSSAALIDSLCKQLYKSGQPLLRTRAILSHIYHHALANNFETARDMMLMSHLQDSIHATDAGTQIVYNRVVVQLGLAAFRQGLVREAHSILQEIFSTQRVKELLAQGLHQQRYGVVLTPEQEKADRARQLPFHMHINLELLEAAFLVSCMLVEVPTLASLDTEEQRRKAVSKPFRRLLDYADRQVFMGPPEHTRDHIMQASRALQDGEWEKCRDLIQGMKVWSLMGNEKQVKEMLAQRIQEEGVRTYLFTFAPYYTTVSLELLSKTFSLPVRSVTSIVSKMIWNEELAASLDQETGVVVFTRTELTRVQQLAQALSERVANLVDANEKALDLKLGGGIEGRGTGEAGKTGERKEGGTAGTGERRFDRTRTQRAGATRGTGFRGERFSQGLGNRVGGAQNAGARTRVAA